MALSWRSNGARFVPALAALVAVATAQETPPVESATDKSAFHLFNPTPAVSLRPMTVDGPGTTESPYTLDAGHFQLEMALVSYSIYEESFPGGRYRLESWSVGPVNIKAGLFNRVDLQLVVEPYLHVVESETDFYRETRSGPGDTTVRVKVNCWGNDEGSTALAAMPYCTFPTSEVGLGNDHIQAGLILPFSISLPGDFYLGLTSRFGAVRAEGATDYHAEFSNSVSLSRELFRDLELFVEFYDLVSTERDVDALNTLNTGLMFWLTDNLQLNAGVNYGLSDSADDWHGYFGMAWRY